MPVRMRMVLFGLVLGVVIAVAFAAQGCGAHHPRRPAPAATAVPTAVGAGPVRFDRGA
jgi:hypothetical protein